MAIFLDGDILTSYKLESFVMGKPTIASASWVSVAYGLLGLFLFLSPLRIFAQPDPNIAFLVYSNELASPNPNQLTLRGAFIIHQANLPNIGESLVVQGQARIGQQPQTISSNDLRGRLSSYRIKTGKPAAKTGTASPGAATGQVKATKRGRCAFFKRARPQATPQPPAQEQCTSTIETGDDDYLLGMVSDSRSIEIGNAPGEDNQIYLTEKGGNGSSYMQEGKMECSFALALYRAAQYFSQKYQSDNQGKKVDKCDQPPALGLPILQDRPDPNASGHQHIQPHFISLEEWQRRERSRRDFNSTLELIFNSSNFFSPIFKLNCTCTIDFIHNPTNHSFALLITLASGQVITLIHTSVYSLSEEEPSSLDDSDPEDNYDTPENFLQNTLLVGSPGEVPGDSGANTGDNNPEDNYDTLESFNQGSTASFQETDTQLVDNSEGTHDTLPSPSRTTFPITTGQVGNPQDNSVPGQDTNSAQEEASSHNDHSIESQLHQLAEQFKLGQVSISFPQTPSTSCKGEAGEDDQCHFRDEDDDDCGGVGGAEPDYSWLSGTGYGLGRYKRKYLHQKGQPTNQRGGKQVPFVLFEENSFFITEPY